MSEMGSQEASLEDKASHIGEEEERKVGLVKLLNILLGRGDNKSKKVSRFDIIRKSITLLNGCLYDYKKSGFPEDVDLDFAVTYIHPETRKLINSTSCARNSIFDCYEKGADFLKHFLPASDYFNKITTTDSHKALAERIMNLYLDLDGIRNEIFTQQPVLTKTENDTSFPAFSSSEWTIILKNSRQTYIREEFERRKIVIPLLNEMISIYMEGKTLIENTIKDLKKS